jgi:hypothetical protein
MSFVFLTHDFKLRLISTRRPVKNKLLWSLLQSLLRSVKSLPLVLNNFTLKEIVLTPRGKYYFPTLLGQSDLSTRSIMLLNNIALNGMTFTSSRKYCLFLQHFLVNQV